MKLKHIILETLDIYWYRFKHFVNNWIYPGYYMRNLLWNRFDIIKMHKIKPYEYSDVVLRVAYANFELIKFFIEKENPEKHVEWYGEYGHKYGERPNIKILFPELKDRYIMDLIKEIYNFYTVELPKLESDKDYLLGMWSKYIYHIEVSFTNNCKKKLKLVRTTTNEMLEDPQFIKDANWDIILKYIDNKNDFFVDKKIFNIIDELEAEILRKTQYYLHLIIEVREYLWS